MMITIPRDIRRRPPWLHARQVGIEYHPPFLIIRPLTLDELMKWARSEEEDLPLDEVPHPKP